MQQSYLNTAISDAEYKLLRDQDHIDYVWSVMEPILNGYIDGFLDGIAYSNDQALPQENFTAFLKKQISDNDKLHDKYHSIFDMDAMEEYAEDTEGFKSAVLKRECDVIRKALASRTEAMQEWKSKFYGCKSQVLYDTFYNMITFASDYAKKMDEEAMLAL